MEDCLRKLWFSISYQRISQAWNKYGALDEAHHGFVPNRGPDSSFVDLLNQLEKISTMVNLGTPLLMGY
jgi:hypothetical protein